MQEINLLQNKVKDRTLQFERSSRIVMTVFTLILILEILATAGLYFLTSSVKAQTTQISQKNAEIQSSMNSNQKDLAAAQGLQAQLKNVRVLLNDHVYWSSFFDSVAKAIPKGVWLQGVDGSTDDGKIHLEGTAPSYQDAGRLILSLSTAPNFKDVKLESLTPSEQSTFGYSFSLNLRVAPTIFNKKQ